MLTTDVWVPRPRRGSCCSQQSFISVSLDADQGFENTKRICTMCTQITTAYIQHARVLYLIQTSDVCICQNMTLFSLFGCISWVLQQLISAPLLRCKTHKREVGEVMVTSGG